MSSRAIGNFPGIFAFGTFELDPRSMLLYRGGALVPLAPKTVEVLLALVESAPDVVTKQELTDRVWAESFVGESSITKNISILRKLLREEFGGVEPIRNISKRGYQLTVPVELRVSAQLAPAPPTLEPVEPQPVGEFTTEVALAPEALATAAPQGVIAKPHYAPLRLAFVSGVFACLCVVGLLSWGLAGGFGHAHAPKRRSIAVLDLKDLSNTPNEQWLGAGLSEMLRSELLIGGGAQTISGERVANMRSDLKLSPEASYQPGTLKRIQSNLACDAVVTGSFAAVGDRVRVDLQVANPATGEISEGFSETVPRQNIFDLVADAGRAVRSSLGIAAARPQNAAAAQFEIPPNALEPYSEGLTLLRHGDALAAQRQLSAATAAAPDYAPAHAALAAAWATTGYDARARDEASKAFANESPLPREQKLQVEGQYFEAIHDWPKAIETYSALWRFYPDQLEYAVKLVAAQVGGNRAKDALDTVHKIEAADPAALRNSRLLIAAANAYQTLSDYPGEVQSANAAVEAARAAGSPLMEARALLKRGYGNHRLGHNDQAAGDYQSALRVATDLGDDAGIASALLAEGQRLYDRNDAAAEDTLRRALEIEERIGFRSAAAHTLQTLAGIRRGVADMNGARDLFRQSLAIMVDIGDGPGEAINHINLGNIANNTGDAAGARAEYGVAMQRAREVGDRRTQSIAIGNTAILDYSAGDLRQAVEGLQQALTLKRAIGDKGNIAYTLGWLGDIAIDAADFSAAHKYIDEKLALLKSAGLDTARDGIGPARLAIEEGRPEAAEAPMAKLAAQSLHPNPGAEAWRVLAESRLVRGDLKGARAAAESGVALAAKSPNLADYGIPTGILAARVDAAEGHKSSALASLRALLANARKLKNYPLELEARLYLARIAGEKTQIAAVAKEAESRGFVLFAHKALAPQ
jgi:DNA-binding winged helix-turn-helix (wHTH) protein/tetratricopeptide (TPR) repeat protein